MTWIGLSDQNLPQISLPMFTFLFSQLMLSVKWKAAVLISAVALDVVVQVLLIQKFNYCELPAGIKNGFMIKCRRQYHSSSWRTFLWKLTKC